MPASARARSAPSSPGGSTLTTAFQFRSESGEPGPTALVEVDDRLTADAALKQVRRGEFLLYARGDFHNAKQLLAAMGRRLAQGRREPPRTPGEAFRQERRARALEHETLSRLLVCLDGDYRLALKRAPEVATACHQVWGPPPGQTLVALKTLLGMLGAAQWRQAGLKVPGLAGLLTPHYGVYLPTRTDYVELVAAVKPERGARVLDVGTGTGVLSFLLLQRGAGSALGTDSDERAVACATESARRLGLAGRFSAVLANLWPAGDERFDLVVCNPPWLPEAPRNRVDRAVFDEDSRFLLGFLEGASARLAPGGQVLLVLSDLAVLLGLREPGWLEAQLARVGLVVRWRRDTAAKHGRAKDRQDPLHEARSRERTSLYGLAVAG